MKTYTFYENQNNRFPTVCQLTVHLIEYIKRPHFNKAAVYALASGFEVQTAKATCMSYEKCRASIPAVVI